MSHTEERPATKAALIERVVEIIRTSHVLVMGSIDDSQQLVMTSMGVDPNHIPDILRRFAEHLEREAHVEAVRRAVAEMPADRKGLCPSCDHEVVVTRPIPPKALERTEGFAVCVCTCGAFLVPYLNDARELQLRLMTQAEIIDLPDDIRNRLVRTRRDFERMRNEESN